MSESVLISPNPDERAEFASEKAWEASSIPGKELQDILAGQPEEIKAGETDWGRAVEEWEANENPQASAEVQNGRLFIKEAQEVARTLYHQLYSQYEALPAKATGIQRERLIGDLAALQLLTQVFDGETIDFGSDLEPVPDNASMYEQLYHLENQLRHAKVTDTATGEVRNGNGDSQNYYTVARAFDYAQKIVQHPGDMRQILKENDGNPQELPEYLTEPLLEKNLPLPPESEQAVAA